ncbi:MAG: antibiotic biosynthesis monooxygenase [Polyangiaceae bacterium]|jgi:heme-degrading monooxygenase HmoA|nr:antibiotic biosynthesis monooxygenase [Polyangiaceae bacterium]
MRTPLVLAALTLLACSEESSTTPAPTPASTGDTSKAAVEPPGCERSTALEPDLAFTDWVGPAVDPKTGKLALPEGSGYLVATTRLNLRKDGQELFGKHIGAIFTTIEQQPGFLAFQTGISDRCGVARTLSVWKDEESLYGFVTSGAHKAAIDDTPKMSRGLSNTTHFPATSAAEVSWTRAAQAIGEDDGPFY